MYVWFVLYFSFLFPYLSEKWLGRKEKVSKCVIAVVFKFLLRWHFFRALQDYPVLESKVDNERLLRFRLVNMQTAILPVFFVLHHVVFSCDGIFITWNWKWTAVFFSHCLYFKVTGYFQVGVSHVQVMQRVPVKLKIPQTLY